MKTDETRLTQWTTDAITFDLADGPGVTRVYTREGFTRLSETLSRLAHQRIYAQRDLARKEKRARKMKLGMTCQPTSEDEELNRLRALNPDATEHLVTAPMMKLAEAFGRYGAILTDEEDPTKDAPPETMTDPYLTTQRLLAYEGVRELQQALDRHFIETMSQAIKSLELPTSR